MVDFKALNERNERRRKAGCVIRNRDPDYFDPPFGGRPPSAEAVTKATQRYIEEERKGVGIFQRRKRK